VKKDGHLKKEINLLLCTGIEPNFQMPGVINSTEFAFAVKTLQRDWVFLTCSQDEMYDWVAAIHSLCRDIPSDQRHSKEHPKRSTYVQSYCADLAEASSTICLPSPQLRLSPIGHSHSLSAAGSFRKYQRLRPKSASSATTSESCHVYEDVEYEETPKLRFPRSQILSSNALDYHYVVFSGYQMQDTRQKVSRSYESPLSWVKEHQEQDVSSVPTSMHKEDLIEMQFGGDKRIQLLKTSSERHLVGKEGCLLGSICNNWVFCIPPGALHYEQEIVVSFYHVIDSISLESSEFVSGIIEITPHQLTFFKSCELLLHHHLCLDSSSEVTVLYHSGQTYDEPTSSLCLLNSIDDTVHVHSTDMRMTLWDDLIHIETPHVCRFGVDCKGKSFIEVWASLFASDRPHPDHFLVRLSLSSQAPSLDDEDAKMMLMYKLVRKGHQQIVLNCRLQEKLVIDVQILPEHEGWKVLGSTAFSHTVAYSEIKDMVIHGKPVKTNDYWFTRGKALVDVTGFAPVFRFNGDRCLLAPPEFSSKPSIMTVAGDSSDQLSQSLNPVGEKSVNSTRPDASWESGLSMKRIMGTIKRIMDEEVSPSEHIHDNIVPRKSQLSTHSLDRPVMRSDIQFISGCEYITHRWKEIGWLMLSGSGYTMEDVRNDVVKHFLNDSDSVKVIHLIEQWQIHTNYRATVRELVDICCHPIVGGVRHQLEMSLANQESYRHTVMNPCKADGVLERNDKCCPSTVVPDLKSVIKAVMKVTPDQWQSIGLEMGFTIGQLNSVTGETPNPSNKLQVIARLKASAIGKERTAILLLDICKKLPCPKYAEVMEELNW
jgi:hypothetical protein